MPEYAFLLFSGASFLAFLVLGILGTRLRRRLTNARQERDLLVARVVMLLPLEGLGGVA